MTTTVRRDDNSVPALLAVSSVDGVSLVEVWADPTTHRLLCQVIGGVNSFSIGEIPSGSGTTFTLAHTPVSGTVAVYRGGARQLEGAGNDYTISGSTITFAVSVGAGEVIQVDYQY